MYRHCWSWILNVYTDTNPHIWMGTWNNSIKQTDVIIAIFSFSCSCSHILSIYFVLSCSPCLCRCLTVWTNDKTEQDEQRMVNILKPSHRFFASILIETAKFHIEILQMRTECTWRFGSTKCVTCICRNGKMSWNCLHFQNWSHAFKSSF